MAHRRVSDADEPCVSSSDPLVPGQTLFAEPWWLEAVAPSRWDIAVVEHNGVAVGAWPYTISSLPGRLIRAGAGPLCPYLGPSTRPLERSKRPKEISWSYRILNELVDQLPEADLWKCNLRVDQGPWYPLHGAGFSVSLRQTYVLDLDEPVERLWDECSSSTRGAIRKAEKRLVVTAESDGDLLWSMVGETFARQGESVPYSKELLDRVVDAALTRNRGQVLVARDDAGRVHAATFIVWDDERAYYLVGGADPELRESGALSLLVWEAVKLSARVTRTFDFEGSMLPNVERFFSRFGGRPESPIEITRFSAKGRAGWQAMQLGRAAQLAPSRLRTLRQR